MKILLAGYNVDADVLEELKKNSPLRQDVTPETLSAAYARISRDPRPIDELRKIARSEVESARKSNSAIIFKMGHHSVAEHAVFNFDIMGVSRFAVEAIEHFRLNSFTEKSQRYITLENDFIIPDEIKGTDIEEEFVNTIKTQNVLYQKLNEKLSVHIFNKHEEFAKEAKNKNLLEGWAKEDARYITSLATHAQLGLTINARNLELLFRRFASQGVSEIKEISKKMFALAQKIAPSIILFTEANDFDGKTYGDIKKVCGNKMHEAAGQNSPDVVLADHTKNPDNILIASIIYSATKEPFGSCMNKVKNMSFEQKEQIVKTSGKYMQFYDSVLREFESIDFVFDLSLSSSCFAQLKRHRMSTIICQPYNTSLGVTIPPAIEEIGMKGEFMDVIGQTENVYNNIAKRDPVVAQYILTNAHKRRVLFKCNARELYHISRLREDSHAQWDIQNVSRQMTHAAKSVAPLAMMFIGGKEVYPKIHQEIFCDSSQSS
jgi:flavin-dependent thymidylate synthase